jgi:hypothetical protein
MNLSPHSVDRVEPIAPLDHLDNLVEDLKRTAREQKRRTAQRLLALRGDWTSTPSRGPVQTNGRLCIRWHFWMAAGKKARKITDQITSIQSLQKRSKNPMKKPFHSVTLAQSAQSAYTTAEILIFLGLLVTIGFLNYGPIMAEKNSMQDARTQAAVAEINYRKQRYLFESNPKKIESFNTSGDLQRWEILSENLMREGKNTRNPYEFMRYTGKSQIKVGADDTAPTLE